jgi:hypothetical protein
LKTEKNGEGGVLHEWSTQGFGNLGDVADYVEKKEERRVRNGART